MVSNLQSYYRWLLFGWFLASWSSSLVTASSSSSGNPSSYTSVRALDQFGNSVQLKHAREAADRHGRLVVAAAAGNDNTVVVVSLGNRPMVHSISLPTQDNNDDATTSHHHLALCCTGVKGDANWLVAQVQEHAAQIWERYNHHPYSPAIAHLVARLLGSFGGEDVDQEWQSSIRRESVEWARPFGIQTMILSTQDPCILMVEPSGRVLATTTTTKKGNKDKKTPSFWCAMGKESNAVREKQSRTELLGDDGAFQLQEKLVQQLLDTVVVSRNDITEVMVEILTPVGIERTLLQYKNGEQLSSSNVQI
jgi:20S proteasome alpha/beta subunit